MSPSATSSTRRHPPIDVFQDSDTSFMANDTQGIENALMNALQPLSDASNNQNLKLRPTIDSQRQYSPSKTDSSPPRPISAHSLTDITIPPPQFANTNAMSPLKNAAFYQSRSADFGPPETAIFGQFPNVTAFDKENYETASFHAQSALPYGELDYGFKSAGKRTFMDSAPFKDRASIKKPKFEEEEPFDLPHPEDMPNVVDDGSKPPHSYATLIGMAILRSSHRRLTLAQIYKWISDNFAFYRLAESGWQNSIRHNLSLNKNFIKQERPKDDPGKGNYWAIKPGQERPFLVDKKHHIRRITNPDGSQYIHGLPSDMGNFRPSTAPAIGHFTLAPNPSRKNEIKTIDSAKFDDEPEPSSDGTIDASDQGLDDEDAIDRSDMPPPAHMRSSPPPEGLNSSPPQMLSQPKHKDTPPPVPRFPSTSRSGGRRAKFAGLNDSGYWSSLESSAARNAAHQLTSEADINRPRIKKGRAEAEIARLRSSSFDSPSKDQRAPTPQFQLSSPVHKEESPLTPAIVFKRPAKPPPSISPNTNLRNHRNRLKALLGTPAKPFSPMPDTNIWSPAFNDHEDVSVGITSFLSPLAQSITPFKPCEATPGMSSSKLFDIFIDAPEELTARGSPEKRSVRRPSLVRAATTTGILADVTGSSKGNSLTLAPAFNSPVSLAPSKLLPGALRSPAHFGSPLKMAHKPSNSQSPPNVNWFDDENLQPSSHALSTADAAELFGVDLPSDGSEEAIDLFQNFGKIGQQQQQQKTQQQAPDRSTGSPVRRSSMAPPPARPMLGRSNTSRW